MNAPIRASLDSSLQSSGWAFRSPDAMPQVLRCPSLSAGATLDVAGDVRCVWDDPSDALRQLRHLAPGRWVGYFSYDFGRHFERLPDRAEDDLGIPLFALMEFGRLHPPAAQTPISGHARGDRPSTMRSTFSRESYIASVKRVLEYIAAGDAYQVNLAQRFTMPLMDDPWQIYERLRERSPATHGAFLDFGDFQIISNSPELFFRVTPDRRIVVRPIKGTRPNKPGMDAELRRSKKDQAELAMIVDLERNDLGRICEIGSVKVIEPRAIETHPTVFHGVATIEGRLRNDVTFIDILTAMFPSGSVTGAPKIRAMQIIDELEPVRRGPYCGAIGYIDADGTIEFNVAIRTMIVKDGQVHIPVGGGIVADSDPEAEYEETLDKAQAMFSALGVSAASLK